MRYRFLIPCVAVVAAMVAAFYGFQRLETGLAESARAATPPAPRPAMPVPVAKVVKKTIPVYLDYSARTESIRAINLQAKVSGFVQEQPVTDGTDVKAGELLYRLDPRDFQAVLDQANAQVERDVASLDYQRSNFRRGDELAKSGWLAKDTFDQRSSTLKQAQASLTMDRALGRTAELNLSYTEIRAPFAGRVGRNQAPNGTLVSVGGTTLNTLVQLDPIYVTFNPSETELRAIEEARQAGAVDAEVVVPGAAGAPHIGKLTFIDNSVDRSTGTLTARATIANADFTLLPGQYVRVRLRLRQQPDALLVPQVAVGSSQLGKYVYVVTHENTVDQRLVSLGTIDGDLVAITKGVAEGDRVITGNLQKIGPGMPVQALEPKAASPS